MDCIFSVPQIIVKHGEFNIPTYIAFIDFKNAFDSVDRDKLWTIMLSKGKKIKFKIEILPKSWSIELVIGRKHVGGLKVWKL